MAAPLSSRPGGASGNPTPATRPAKLEFRDLQLRLGSRTVLDRLRLVVRPGEVLGILGPNGAGKTSLFRVLCGLWPVDAGELLLDGRPVRPGDRAVRARCGVVFQEPALDLRLTARQNLALAARLYRVRAGAAATRIDELLRRVGLSERADEPLRRLSGGMRRRIELVRALIHEPELLILDEPTTGLDEAAFRGIWRDLQAMRRRSGLTLLLTTHRADEAEQCDRIAFLDGGRILACDTPDRLRERVRGDLVVIEAAQPALVAATLRDRLGVSARAVDGKLMLREERAHELIPRIVEALPAGALTSVGMRRTGLGEVFLELAGHELDGEGTVDSGDGDR